MVVAAKAKRQTAMLIKLFNVPSTERSRNKFWELKRCVQAPSKKNQHITDEANIPKEVDTLMNSLKKQSEVVIYVCMCDLGIVATKNMGQRSI